MFNKTVDSITKAFTKAITEFQELEAAHLKKIDTEQITIKEASDRITASAAEVKRSQTIRARLENIVNV